MLDDLEHVGQYVAAFDLAMAASVRDEEAIALIREALRHLER